MIGPNGSGKTTLFNCITGLIKPSSGSVILRNEHITGRKPYEIARKGIGRTFQDVRLFRKMKVVDHLLLAGEKKVNIIFSSILRSSQTVKREKEIEKNAMDMLEFLKIRDLHDKYASDLSYGQQKLLELGIVLMNGPKIILLDEPTGGVNPTLINKIKERILELHKSGMTFVVIEHNMSVIMDISERIVCLDAGEAVACGRPEEIQRNPKVIEAYFGG